MYQDTPSSYFVPLLLFAGVLFYNPALYFQFFSPVYMACVTAGAIAFLSLALILFSFDSALEWLRHTKRSALFAMLLFVLIVIGHGILNSRYRFLHFGESLIWIFLPCCVSVFFAAFRHSLGYFLAVLGFFNLVHCVLVPRTGGWIWGMTGNINFTSALIVITLPFLILYSLRLLKRSHKIPRLLTFVPAGVFLICGLKILWECASRGTLLALLFTALLFLFFRLNDFYRRCLLYGILLLGIIAVLLFLRFGVDPLSRMLADEDRPFMYSGTLRMIADHPVFGVGGVSFENEFIPYKPQDYFFTRHVAERINHPHNEILFLMSSFGIAGFLALAVLIFYPLWVFFRRMMRQETLELEWKLYFFIFIYLLVHAQFDMIFFVWPTNVLALMILGLLWHFAFQTDRPSFRLFSSHPAILKNIARGAGVIILIFTGIGIARSTASSWMTWRLMTVKMPRQERLRIMDRVSSFAPDEYRQNYALMILAERLNAPEMTLKISDAMIHGTIENYGHVYLHRGNALARLGRYEEAYEAYRRDSKNYPLTVLPYLRMITLCRRIGRETWIPDLEKRLNELLALRGITPRMLTAVQKNPFYDMRPWQIPVAEGGQGGYFSELRERPASPSGSGIDPEIK